MKDCERVALVQMRFLQRNLLLVLTRILLEIQVSLHDRGCDLELLLRFCAWPLNCVKGEVGSEGP